MRLKRLELQGYKSFPGRVEFVFPTGITAIVGPNGSGKSNVADGIRWALGEQSLRSLRGKTTEDMIFAGSQRRSRSGMAEVLLTLDNSGGWLPVDFSEVTVGRRAYRSGDSEYLLNGNRVRLRDVNQLLAESGLSERTYAVIGQGLIDTALSLRPQERRALFEEAAGISVYRSQREDAAARLQETAHNLERVRDILSEIEPNMRRLEQQLDLLREHERASTHLARLLRTWYGYHWGQAQEAFHAAQKRAQALEERLDAQRAEAHQASADLVRLREQQTALRARLRDAYHRSADLHDQADIAQRELAALTERTRLFAARRDELDQEIAPLLAQQDAQQARVRDVQSQVDAIESRARSAEQRVAALEQALRRLRDDVQQQARRRQETRREIDDLRRRREELDRAIDQARAAQVRLEAEQEILARMREEGDALGQGVRTLLKADLPGVEGLLGALIDVPREWESAIEAALGARLRALVVKDWSVVSAARAALGAGERAMLIVLESDAEPPVWSAPPGARRAADVVGSASHLRPLVERLLGRTLVVENLDVARAALRHLPAGGRCIARSGEIVAADGTAVVGEGHSATLARERTWRELPERLAAAQQRQAELEADRARVEERLETLSAALDEAERALDEASRAAAAAESGPLAEARTQAAVTRQALSSERALLQRETSAMERNSAQVAAHRARLGDLEREKSQVQERLAQLQQETGRFEAELSHVRAAIGPAEDELSRLIEQQEQAEQAERQTRGRLRRAEEIANDLRLKVARHQDRLNQLQERIQEDLGLVELEVADPVTVQTPLPLRPFVSSLPIVEALPEGLEEEIQRLKARLRQLGPVNPNAAQDYEETRERYHFLTGQVTDLETASARLQEVIAELDGLMETAFRETFQAIAAAFEKTFARLFGGGSAQLELTEPDDLQATGVDIVARPPGKRLQSLALLSGGERALSAAALIFAILRVRPTPVCVLDEVDAMLDEANVGRFREMLVELSTETQFIIITHNRHTVEAADTVYGVSMGTEGASQVVSLRMGHEETK